MTISREAREVSPSESLIATQHPGSVILGNVYIIGTKRWPSRGSAGESRPTSATIPSLDLMAGLEQTTKDDGWNGWTTARTPRSESGCHSRIEQTTGLQDLV